MGHRPTVTTDPLNQQQPTIQIQTRVTVGHEDLRTGEDGYLHRTPEVFPTSTHQPHCHQPVGRVHLGMSVGELWPLSRVTVVVEGLHDEAVLTSLLRDSLDAAPAGVYATHGGTRLKSLAEPALIINATDAEILVVLDELQSSRVDPLWTEIKHSVAAGDFDAARKAIDAPR